MFSSQARAYSGSHRLLQRSRKLQFGYWPGLRTSTALEINGDQTSKLFKTNLTK